MQRGFPDAHRGIGPDDIDAGHGYPVGRRSRLQHLDVFQVIYLRIVTTQLQRPFVYVHGENLGPLTSLRQHQSQRPPTATHVNQYAAVLAPVTENRRRCHLSQQNFGTFIQAVSGKHPRGGANPERVPAQNHLEITGVFGPGRLGGKVLLRHGFLGLSTRWQVPT